ncbi:solute carrier family 17 member 9 isoform X4 [Fukomys damarensis]|uniref:solute carrier family 17 member 9 isoform X4 n=1 Tax=Fukomys damarensis TaxID=885580 RepID=UPI0008FEB6E0|nr:solute carrier family 17 member 9 isoform X4 [Fukomys damarensis]
MQPSTDQAHRDAAEDARWSRPECQVWTGTLLLGTCLLYCVRVTMPVCAVAMSQDFGWDKKEAGMVLSSFFWGYCLTQVVGGHLGDRIGGEKVILLSATTWGFVTVATPMLAHLSNARLVSMAFSRVLTGLLQAGGKHFDESSGRDPGRHFPVYHHGEKHCRVQDRCPMDADCVYFPALTSLLSQRVPEGQRAFACSMVGAGSQFGTLVTGAVGSLLLDWCGWQSVFYFSGGLALLWVCYVYRFLLNEQDLIPALGVLVQGPPLAGAPKVPWRQLFWKPSVWAAICSQLSSACAFFILLSWLPTFFKETFPHSKISLPKILTCCPAEPGLGPAAPPRRAGSSMWCPGWLQFLPVYSAGFSLTILSVRVAEPSLCGSSCRWWALACPAFSHCVWVTHLASSRLWSLHRPPSASRPSTTAGSPLTSRTWPPPVPAFCLVWPTRQGPWQGQERPPKEQEASSACLLESRTNVPFEEAEAGSARRSRPSWVARSWGLHLRPSPWTWMEIVNQQSATLSAVLMSQMSPGDARCQQATQRAAGHCFHGHHHPTPTSVGHCRLTMPGASSLPLVFVDYWELLGVNSSVVSLHPQCSG